MNRPPGGDLDVITGDVAEEEEWEFEDEPSEDLCLGLALPEMSVEPRVKPSEGPEK